MLLSGSLHQLLFVSCALGEFTHIAAHSGKDFALDHFDHGERFDVEHLYVILHQNFVARVDLGFGEDLVACEQSDVLFTDEVGQCVGSGLEVKQTALLCFGYPFFGVVVAVIVGQLIGISARPTPGIIMLALLFSCAVGLFFGFNPARKASKLNPIDALRSE